MSTRDYLTLLKTFSNKQIYKLILSLEKISTCSFIPNSSLSLTGTAIIDRISISAIRNSRYEYWIINHHRCFIQLNTCTLNCADSSFRFILVCSNSLTNTPLRIEIFFWRWKKNVFFLDAITYSYIQSLYTILRFIFKKNRKL